MTNLEIGNELGELGIKLYVLGAKCSLTQPKTSAMLRQVGQVANALAAELKQEEILHGDDVVNEIIEAEVEKALNEIE